ncbi:MAG: ABC transporter ATP-binding protein, partial [Alcaligenaceae bacterium]|nr:ABC transporter ATP-binding protein [Alcaligenaceae bacterium]
MSLLSVEQIDVIYGSGSQANRVVHDFSLELSSGEIVCL